jgi:hypothetical protein
MHGASASWFQHATACRRGEGYGLASTPDPSFGSALVLASQWAIPAFQQKGPRCYHTYVHCASTPPGFNLYGIFVAIGGHPARSDGLIRVEAL